MCRRKHLLYRGQLDHKTLHLEVEHWCHLGVWCPKALSSSKSFVFVKIVWNVLQIIYSSYIYKQTNKQKAMWDTATLLNHRLSHDTLPSCLQSLCSAKRTSDWLLPKISALKGFSQPDVPQNSRPSHLKFKQEVNMQHSFTSCWDSEAAVYKLNRRRPGQTMTLLPLSCCWFLNKRMTQTRNKLRQQGDRETYKKISNSTWMCMKVKLSVWQERFPKKIKKILWFELMNCAESNKRDKHVKMECKW